MKTFSLKNIKFLFNKYERYLSSGALLFGFIFDNLTLQRVDFIFDNLIIISYLLLVGFCITFINLHQEGRLKGSFIEKFYEFLPFIMQFAFGGLFSAFVVFYSRSASLLSSGPFVVVLAILLIGNEFFKNQYQKLVFQVSLYFIGIFSFAIFFLPVLTKQMGALVFLGSGFVSICFISLFIFFISKTAQKRFTEKRNTLLSTIFCLFVFINTLYFTNIIPPIPLSLKEADVYHSIIRNSDGSYLATYELGGKWYDIFNPSKDVYLKPNSSLFLFSSIFAPTNLNTQIIHDWQYFDGERNSWVSASKIIFSIKGGRDQGFRGFSKKEGLWAGKWRVLIKTTRNQIIGRVRFDIKNGEPLQGLSEKSL